MQLFGVFRLLVKGVASLSAASEKNEMKGRKTWYVSKMKR